MAAVIPDISALETHIVAQTNAFRRSQGLAALTANPKLAAAARAYADFLARTGKLAHGADGKTQTVRAAEQGYAACSSAENLALHADGRGFAAEGLAKQIVEGWKGSPAHRRNLMLAHATEVGVAVARVPAAVPKFVSVQLIARPQALEQSFRIENRAERKVEYTLNGKRSVLEVRTSVTHKTCAPAEVTVHLPGTGWLAGTKDQRLAPAPGSVLTVTKGAGGGLAVESRAGGARQR